MKVDVFRKEIERLMRDTKERGAKYIDITSGDVYRNLKK